MFCFDLISRKAIYIRMITLFAIVLILIPVIASAAVITVRSARDELNEDGDCSLREAIASANQDRSFDNCEAGNGADIIEFAPREVPRLFILMRAGIDNDSGTFGDLDITDDLTIMGRGEAETIIQLGADRTSIERVFDIIPAAGQTISVTLANLTLTVADNLSGQTDHGYGIRNRAGGILRLEQVTIRDLQSNAAGDGVVFNEGDLTLDQSSLINNLGGESGGIVNLGTLNVLRSRILGNTGPMGGGIHNASIAIIQSSTLAGNDSNRGGAIFNMPPGVMVIENSTLSGNQSEGAGAIDNQHVLTVRHSTITDNTSNLDTGGIRSDSVVRLSHTILAGNTAAVLPQMDCNGADITSLGYNLSGVGCPNTGMGDQMVSGDLVLTAILEPLQDNGGPTPTHALQSGSLAIDAGGVDCPPPGVDQRGAPRPSDGDGDGLPACDIGAFEADPVASDQPLLLVSGRANIGSAGLDRAVVRGCGVSDPGNLPPFAPIPPGVTTVRLTAMGNVVLNDDASPLGPDGEVVGETSYTGPDGIGGLITERRGFLAGIFATNSPPTLPAPPPITVTGQEQTQSMIMSPPLQPYNLFYIGDGLTTAGQTLVVQIPPGSTRLYLGVVDACAGEAQLGSYDDNSGTWTVNVEFVSNTTSGN